MSDTLSPEQVERFLADNPNFLADHPQVLDSLKIPHATEGTSLIEHQVAVLQDQVRDLRRQLHQFRAVAAENEALLARMHQFQLEMVQSDNLGELLDAVERRLRQEFDCRHVALALYDTGGMPEHPLLVKLTDERDPFEQFAGAAEPVCGRLRGERLQVLFGAGAGEVQSAAIASLDRGVAMGLLALGSRDEHKFHPGMGTLFLSLMAQTLGHCLAQRMPDSEQRLA